MPSHKIKLITPVALPGQKPIAEVELKEPSAALYVRLGEPRTPVFGSSGSMYFIENAEVIGKYLDALLVHEHGGEVLLALLSLDDGVAVKNRLLSFFDRAVTRLSSGAQIASSSASE
jgi:hypothetical protein